MRWSARHGRRSPRHDAARQAPRLPPEGRPGCRDGCLPPVVGRHEGPHEPPPGASSRNADGTRARRLSIRIHCRKLKPRSISSHVYGASILAGRGPFLRVGGRAGWALHHAASGRGRLLGPAARAPRRGRPAAACAARGLPARPLPAHRARGPRSRCMGSPARNRRSTTSRCPLRGPSGAWSSPRASCCTSATSPRTSAVGSAPCR